MTGSNTILTPGSGVNAGNNADTDYAGNAGRGAPTAAANTAGTAGNPGLVVIIW